MKIYTPFNYIFYCLLNWFYNCLYNCSYLAIGFYKSREERHADGWLEVVGIIASLQWINIMTLADLIFGKAINTDRFLMILVPIYVALVVLNSLIYRKYERYENMCAMWDEDFSMPSDNTRVHLNIDLINE